MRIPPTQAPVSQPAPIHLTRVETVGLHRVNSRGLGDVEYEAPSYTDHKLKQIEDPQVHMQDPWWKST
jgi:hypothetical protein